MIPFNKPYLTGEETAFVTQAVNSGKISGNGIYTKKCQEFFESNFGFHKTLMTTSCTDALEMSAMLANIEPGDEVIVPSYTFVSSALAFVRERAKIVFADSMPDNPNIDATKIEALITPKTKAIVVVHYAGVACDMDLILAIAEKHNLFVIEDAAQAIKSMYKGKYLGSIGDFGAFSFHETKNIQCGEGGLLSINKEKFVKRAEILWEKGTNRAGFFRGEINKYGWVDTGSSFLPSEITSAYLYAQLMHIDEIQAKRIAIWNRYYENLSELAANNKIKLPVIPEYATNNGHMFYILASDLDERSKLITHLKENEVHAVFHYLSLHKSEYYADKYEGLELNNANYFEDRLLRLPLFNELSLEQVDYVCEQIKNFYN